MFNAAKIVQCKINFIHKKINEFVQYYQRGREGKQQYFFLQATFLIYANIRNFFKI